MGSCTWHTHLGSHCRAVKAAAGFGKELPCLLCVTWLQVFTEEGLIYMVQEYGEIDLARLLAKHAAARKEAGALKDNLDENFIRLYWQQMLQVGQGVSPGITSHSRIVASSISARIGCLGSGRPACI